MAEGDGDFGYEDPDLDNKLDHDDDEEQEVDRTRSCQPGAASTLYHDGEKIEMQTWQHEQTELPETSYEEALLLDDLLSQDERDSKIEEAKAFIRSRFPKADFSKLRPMGYGKKEGNKSFIVSFGSKGGETKILKRSQRSGEIIDLQQKYKNVNSAAMGPEAEDIIAEDRDTIREENQRLIEAEKQLDQAATLAAKKEQLERAKQELQYKRERTQAQIDALQEEHVAVLKLKQKPVG